MNDDSTFRSLLWLICVSSATGAVLLLFFTYWSLPWFDPGSACSAAGTPSEIVVKTMLPPQAVCGSGDHALGLVPPTTHAAIAALCVLAAALAIFPLRRPYLGGRVAMATALGVVAVACASGVIASLTRTQ